jgi:hypothetical protein
MIKYSLQDFTKDNVIKKTKLINIDEAIKVVSDQTDINTANIGTTDISKIADGTIKGAISQLQNDTEFKHLKQLLNAKGESFAFPAERWQEIIIYGFVANGTGCNLIVRLHKNIVTEQVQYIGSTIYASPTSYDTIIVAFTTKGITIHNMICNGAVANGIVNVFYR